MAVIKDQTNSYDQMLIVDKFEVVFDYLYPIAQSIPNKHKVVKEMLLLCLVTQFKLFHLAGKTGQISKLNDADSEIAYLRNLLRLLSKPYMRAMTIHQVETAQVLIAEVGKIMGAWVVKVKRKGQAG
ncbi:diversity-generating retroelement protein Avd [Polynucleobacter sp. AP-RePozz3-80-G7]|uniref:diversity-generating retroelement protein Avd n=1 Tax=Polynucleobacter sp. AP-RePozz3-80-G7 TaxID=2689105 RepID=UPI001C0AA8A8|nr:diversity-generating retroelement protein Avd [Polynucleobacter sp. AP-RePozz3-80-G7]MBU3640028.1 diversity-generating retroelement protein Avd [Polynucleobacter sp. AP-RePozz3-80-G7]